MKDSSHPRLISTSNPAPSEKAENCLPCGPCVCLFADVDVRKSDHPQTRSLGSDSPANEESALMAGIPLTASLPGATGKSVFRPGRRGLRGIGSRLQAIPQGVGGRRLFLFSSSSLRGRCGGVPCCDGAAATTCRRGKKPLPRQTREKSIRQSFPKVIAQG